VSTTEQQLKRIQEKLQQLLKQYNTLQKENTTLKENLASAKDALNKNHQQIETLTRQVDVLMLAAGNMSDADKKEFEKRLNGYIKEIDRSINLLGE
jgi:chromosome segregation ATPase